MIYNLYEMGQYLIEPHKKIAHLTKSNLKKFIEKSHFARLLSGIADTYQRSTRISHKPEFNINCINCDGKIINAFETKVLKKPFCNLIHFEKENKAQQPKVLIISPLSGHFATLQRDTVRSMLEKHDVYITDWLSARDVPLKYGSFGLDDYMDYLIDFMHYIGQDTHVMAVCQPAVQLMALSAIMEEAGDPAAPASIIPIGGPIDPRANKTQINLFAEEYPLDWFEKYLLSTVPLGYQGEGRLVYPGFLQLMAFINMNPDKHLQKHVSFLENCIQNNKTLRHKHIDFYDEYLTTLDMDSLYFTQTIEKIFKTYELPLGTMKYKGQKVNLKAIKKAALLTIEGENDDISAPGQTYAAHALCPNIPAERHDHYLQPGVGHYGVFSGSKWQKFVSPKISEFIYKFDNNF